MSKKFEVCPWCGEKHSATEGRVKGCKCKEPRICICDEEDCDGAYCPKCGRWYGTIFW